MARTRDEIQTEIDDNKKAIALYEDMLSTPELMQIAKGQGFPIRDNMRLCKEAIDRCEKELREIYLEVPSQSIKEQILNSKKYYGCISVGSFHTVGLKTDGTVVAVGKNEYGQCNTKSWRNIVAVSAGNQHTVGLKVDGTVVTVGSGAMYSSFKGRVIDIGCCNTNSWRDIVAVSAKGLLTVGLKADGTQVTTGVASSGGSDYLGDDIVEISIGRHPYDIFGVGDSLYLLALKSDGSVLCCGDIDSTISWRNIVAISAEYPRIGLKADGTVVAVGDNEYGQCNTKSWRNILAISTGLRHTVGLKADDTVVAVGDNKYGQCNVENWQNIVAISAGYLHTVGLKADGTVVAVGYNEYGRCNVENWRNIGPPDKEQLLQSMRWDQQGLCRYCGGQLSGLFIKKCKSCGKPK